MDPQIRELLQKNIAIAEDTNRMVHKLRRGAVWSKLFSLLLWLAFVVLPLAATYYYLQPYLGQMQQIYSQIEAGGQKAQDFELKAQGVPAWISNFFGSFLSNSTSTSN